MPLTEHSNAKGTAALNKGIKILTAIAEAPNQLTVRELSEATELPRPTVYRLLAALIEAGLVRQSRASHAYQLGNTLLSIAHRALDQIDIRDIAHEHLETLRDETGETVHLAVYHKGQMLYVDNLESQERVRMSCSLGASMPLHSTAVGKSFLSFLPESECESMLPQLALTNVTGKSIISLDALRTELDLVRMRGWATDEEENERDIFCFGAPILNREGRPVAAVSVSIPRYRLRANVEPIYVEPLLRTTQAVSRILGYVPRPATHPSRTDLTPQKGKLMKAR